MNRPRLSILAFLAAVIAAGCSGTGGASPTPEATARTIPAFAIRTAAAPPQACMDALITGKLARNPGSGLGLTTVGSPPVVVEWPFRYSAVEDGGVVALIDEKGQVVAHEGDMVQMGGGMGQRNMWFTCGPVERLEAIR